MALTDSYLYIPILEKRRRMSVIQRETSAKSFTKLRWAYPYKQEIVFRRNIELLLKQEVFDPAILVIKEYFSIRADRFDYHADGLLEIKGALTRIGLAAFPESTVLNKIAESISRQNSTQWEKFVNQATGVHLSIYETRREKEVVEAWAKDNLEALRDFSKKQIKNVNQIISDSVGKKEGPAITESRVRGYLGTSSQRQANYIARNSTGNLSSKLQKERMQEAKIHVYKWQTYKDKKVRGNPFGLYPNTKYSHYIMEGKFKRWDNALLISDDQGITWRKVRGREETKHVGIPYNCRCYAVPDFRPLFRTADRNFK